MSNSEEELSVKSARFARDSRHAPLPRLYLTKVASDKQGGTNYDRHLRREVRALLQSRKKRIIAQRRAQACGSVELAHESDWVDANGELLPERQPFDGREVASVLKQEFDLKIPVEPARARSASSISSKLQSPEVELQVLASSTSQESTEDKMRRAARKRSVKTRLSAHGKIKAQRKEGPEQRPGSPEAADTLRDMTSAAPDARDWSTSNLTQQQIKDRHTSPAAASHHEGSKSRMQSRVCESRKESEQTVDSKKSPTKKEAQQSQTAVRKSATPTSKRATPHSKKHLTKTRKSVSPPKVALKSAKTIQGSGTVSEHTLAPNVGVVSEHCVDTASKPSSDVRPVSVGGTARDLAVRLQRGELSRESEEAILSAVASWLSTSDHVPAGVAQTVAAAAAQSQSRAAPTATQTEECLAGEVRASVAKQAQVESHQVVARSRVSQQSCCDSVSQASLFPSKQESTLPFTDHSAATDVTLSNTRSSVPLSCKAALAVTPASTSAVSQPTTNNAQVVVATASTEASALQKRALATEATESEGVLGTSAKKAAQATKPKAVAKKETVKKSEEACSERKEEKGGTATKPEEAVAEGKQLTQVLKQVTTHTGEPVSQTTPALVEETPKQVKAKSAKKQTQKSSAGPKVEKQTSPTHVRQTPHEPAKAARDPVKKTHDAVKAHDPAKTPREPAKAPVEPKQTREPTKTSLEPAKTPAPQATAKKKPKVKEQSAAQTPAMESEKPVPKAQSDAKQTKTKPVQVSSETVQQTISVCSTECTTKLTTQSDTTQPQQQPPQQQQPRPQEQTTTPSPKTSPTHKQTTKSKRHSPPKPHFLEAFHAHHFPSIPTSLVNDRWTRDWRSPPAEHRHNSGETRSQSGIKSRARSSVVGRKTRAEKEVAQEDGVRTRAAHSLDADHTRLRAEIMHNPVSKQKEAQAGESGRPRRLKEMNVTASTSDAQRRKKSEADANPSEQASGSRTRIQKRTKKKVKNKSSDAPKVVEKSPPLPTVPTESLPEV